MTPRRYGPLPYVPITRRPKLSWPERARVALWVNPNIEFFGLDDVMPGNLNERVPREHAKIPNVRNWAVRDYGNRVGIWRLMEVLTRHGIRASAGRGPARENGNRRFPNRLSRNGRKAGISFPAQIPTYAKLCVGPGDGETEEER